MTDDPPRNPTVEATDEDRDSTVEATDEDEGNDPGPRPPRYEPPPQEDLDWRGWVLIALIAVSFFVVPGTILYLPQAQGVVQSVGLSWRQAYLVLPMIPALLLGAAAIWAAVRSRSADE